MKTSETRKEILKNQIKAYNKEIGGVPMCTKNEMAYRHRHQAQTELDAIK